MIAQGEPSAPCLTAAVRETYEVLLSMASPDEPRLTPPISTAELAVARGLAESTLRPHVRALRALGLARRERTVARGRYIYLLPRLAPVHEAAPEQAAAAAVATAGAAPEDESAAAGAAAAARIVAVAERLMEVGVYGGLAQSLAHKPWINLAVVNAWVAHLQADPEVRQMPAVLVALLRSPERCLPTPRLRAPPRVSRPAARPTRPAPAASPSEAALEALWQRALPLLEEKVGHDAARLWLDGSRPISCADGVLVVAVASPQGVAFLMQRRYLALCEAASAAWGQPMRVQLAVARTHQRAQQLG